MRDDDLTPEERETTELVKALIATGNFTPLLQLLRGPDEEPERARSALHLLGELDLDLLVQLALDTLIDQHSDDPAAAEQTRRVSRP